MKKIILIALLAVPVLFTACKPSAEKMQKEIKSLEGRLFSPKATGFDKPAADSLLHDYLTYIERFPEDTLGPNFTFKAANLAMNLDQPVKAVEMFDLFIKKYPTHPKTSVSMFFKAYVYENQMKDLEKAKEAYIQFLDRYPTGDFAMDAQVALNNLGKTPEQMVKEFEAKRKADSTRTADSLAALKKGKPVKKKI
jgi:outer membrane protein assembly factor BamD (BamD/ComL family)